MGCGGSVATKQQQRPRASAREVSVAAWSPQDEEAVARACVFIDRVQAAALFQALCSCAARGGRLLQVQRTEALPDVVARFGQERAQFSFGRLHDLYVREPSVRIYMQCALQRRHDVDAKLTPEASGAIAVSFDWDRGDSQSPAGGVTRFADAVAAAGAAVDEAKRSRLHRFRSSALRNADALVLVLAEHDAAGEGEVRWPRSDSSNRGGIMWYDPEYEALLVEILAGRGIAAEVSDREAKYSWSLGSVLRQLPGGWAADAEQAPTGATPLAAPAADPSAV